MRILFTTPYPVSSATGVGRFVRSLADAFGSRGDVVSIIEPSVDTDIPGLANLLLAARTAWEVVRRRDVQLVHCQTLHLQSLVAGLTARVLGKKVLITVHGPSPPARRAAVVFHTVERLCVKVAHRIVLVAAFLEGEYSRRAVVIPNGVPRARIRASRNRRDEVRASLGVAEEPIVAYIGRVTADKGIMVLKEATGNLRQGRDLPAQLLVVGPIGEELRLEMSLESEPWIHSVGPVDDPAPYLAAAEVFVLPSFREGLPLSLLEAMAVGLPVVASSVGGVPEIVEDGATGLLVPPGNVQALEVALFRILSDPPEASRLGRSAANIIAERYDLERCVDRYRVLYGELLLE